MSKQEIKTRPETLDDIIGLHEVKEKIIYAIKGAVNRNTNLPSFVLSGPPGVGKTTIAHIISRLSTGTVHRIMGTDISSPQDVYDLIDNCKDNDCCFIEESHSLRARAATVLLPIMEERLIVGGLGGSRPAPNVCFIFSTTNAGKLHAALLNRCQLISLNYYSIDDLKKIIHRAGKAHNVDLNDDAALTIMAQSSRGTPRTAIEQRLESVLNVMMVDNLAFSVDTVRKALRMNEVNEYGLDKADLTYCNELVKISKSTGWAPVSLNSLCQSTGYSFDVIVNIIEAYLIKMGIIKVVTKGRILTEYGHNILGVEKTTTTITSTYPSKPLNSYTPKTTVSPSDILNLVESKKVSTLKEICQHFNLKYGLDNPYLVNILNSAGYDVRRHVGIVKIKETKNDTESSKNQN